MSLFLYSNVAIVGEKYYIRGRLMTNAYENKIHSLDIGGGGAVVNVPFCARSAYSIVRRYL